MEQKIKIGKAISALGSEVSGEITITENGTYDVSTYKTANVNVETPTEPPTEVLPTDLANKIINRSITTLTANDLSGVRKIGSHAFAHCSDLTSVEIPENITSIGVGAFYSCIHLPSIIIPDSVTYISGFVFDSCWNLETVQLPNNIEGILDSTFTDCARLTSINIPNGVGVIGSHAFRSCSALTTVSLPNTLTKISMSAFENCTALQKIEFPNNLEQIGSYAFDSSGLGNGETSEYKIIIPDSVTSIGSWAFQYTPLLAGIQLSKNLTAIESYTFQGCQLKEISIPAKVTSIGYSAFYNCKNLKTIRFEGTVDQWKKITLGTSWRYNVPATQIICSNGTVAL